MLACGSGDSRHAVSNKVAGLAKPCMVYMIGIRIFYASVIFAWKSFNFSLLLIIIMMIDSDLI